ncbi:MAG: hypothetical protein RMY36_013125 [Nostoc sp. SerVER01]|nr:hypothetical protein [Nostoc sp. SerVER01]MDZ8083735.1 hypothetical protein [Nostoc sp. DcaGUA01]
MKSAKQERLAEQGSRGTAANTPHTLPCKGNVSSFAQYLTVNTPNTQQNLLFLMRLTNYVKY